MSRDITAVGGKPVELKGYSKKEVEELINQLKDLQQQTEDQWQRLKDRGEAGQDKSSGSPRSSDND